MKQEWHVEMSHMVAVPLIIEASSIDDLKKQIQALADGKKVHHDRPAIGQLTFVDDLDDDGFTRIRAYFMNKHGKRTRFMRVSLGNMAVAA
jgi:hypothetical protein